MKIKTNFKIMRERSRFTQRELAEEIDVPLRTICAFEQGTRNIDNANISLVITLASALNCKIEDILEDKENIEKLKEIYK